jgi:hypothetical protein
MVDASSCARLAAVHPVRGTGEIAEGIFYPQRAGFVTGEIVHIDEGQSPRTLRSVPAIAVEATLVAVNSPRAGPIADLSQPGPAYPVGRRNGLRDVS